MPEPTLPPPAATSAPTPTPAPSDDTPTPADDSPIPTSSPSTTPTSTEPAPALLPTDVAACLGSGSCQFVDRVIDQKPFAPIIPEYILQLRPGLCLDVHTTDVAVEIKGIPGVTLIHFYNPPGYQAVSSRANPGF